MRILICGDRNWLGSYDPFHQILDPLVGQITCVIHGGARGADQKGACWAEFHKIPVLEYKAQWSTYGKRAGPIRNREMLEHGRPERVYAFHDNLNLSKGTRNMIEQALKRGVDVYLCRSNGTFQHIKGLPK